MYIVLIISIYIYLAMYFDIDTHLNLKYNFYSLCSSILTRNFYAKSELILKCQFRVSPNCAKFYFSRHIWNHLNKHILDYICTVIFVFRRGIAYGTFTIRLKTSYFKVVYRAIFMEHSPSHFIRNVFINFFTKRHTVENLCLEF